MFCKNTLGPEIVNSLNAKSSCQTIDERKRLLNEDIKSFDRDFDNLCSDLRKIKNKIISFLDGISQLKGNSEFNEEFAKSRSVVCDMRDHLSSLSSILADSSLTHLLPIDNYDELEQHKLTKRNHSDETQSLKDSTFMLTKNKSIPQFLTFKEHPFTTPGLVEGTISHVVTPWMFYFQPSSLKPQLETMQDDLRYFMEKKNVKNCHRIYREFDLVAARFSADDIWYRARIVSVIENEEGVEYIVFFLDYGNLETLHDSSLCDLPSELVHALGVALCCSLNNISPLDEKYAWPEESTRIFQKFLSQHRCFESVNIRPAGVVETSLIFVELYARNGKVIRDYDFPLDVTRELERLECLKVVKSNENAINWFEYFCCSEDETRRSRGDKFADMITVFNNCDVLRKAAPNFDRRYNSFSHSDRKSSPASYCMSKSRDSKQRNKISNNFEKKYSNHYSYSDIVNSNIPDHKGKQFSDAVKSPQKDSSIRTDGIDHNNPRAHFQTDFSLHSGANGWNKKERQLSKQHFNSKTAFDGNKTMDGPSSHNELREINQYNKTRSNANFNYKPLSICNEAFKIYVSHVESPSRFWSIIGDFGLEHFAKLNKEIDDQFKFFDKNENVKPCASIEVGVVCLVVVDDCLDGEFGKHRAKITGVSWNGIMCEIEVFFVDSGKMKVLFSEKNIFELPPNLIDHYPAMAVPCKLEGIKPIAFKWSEEATRYFRDEVSGSTNLIAFYGTKYQVNDIVCGHDNNPVEIDLRIRRDDDDLDESFITLLSDCGFARLDTDDDIPKSSYNGGGYDSRKVSSDDGFGKFLKGDRHGKFMSKNKSDKRMICKYFNKQGVCRYNDKCRFKHVLAEGSEPASTDALFASCISTSQLESLLPDVGSSSMVIVSAFTNPQNFCINLSFEDSCTRSGEIISPPIAELVKSMNKHYNLKSLPDRSLDNFAEGEIVAVRSQEYEIWLRALVTDNNGVDSCKVFFVDYGNLESVPPYRIRTMEPEFMQFPFQAIKSSLPISSSNGDSWTQDALDCMLSLVIKQKLKANILQRLPCGSLLLDLFMNDGNVERNVANMMIEKGHAICSFLKFTCGAD